MNNYLLIKAGRFAYRKLGLSAASRFSTNLEGSVLDKGNGNQFIYNTIVNGTPAMISRLGTPEARCLINYFEIQDHKTSNYISKIHTLFKGSDFQWKEDIKKDLRDLVGFFPTSDEMISRFAEFYLQQLVKMDAIGIWNFVPGEAYLVNKYCPFIQKFDALALEPYYFHQPWSSALTGKTVLVIHPFSSSIREQFGNRSHLFQNNLILPDFELKLLTAVQSIAGAKTPHSSWFEALHVMYDQIDSIDFDVALIGAGSYGLPLSAYVKEKGKIAIHIGGATQIMFGIKGKRWDDHPIISGFYNSFWKRPSEHEIVPDANRVEGGCYW